MEREALYQRTVPEVLHHYNVDLETGLSEHRAAFERKKFGPNSFENIKEGSVWGVLVRQCSNFFIILLAFAAAISYFVDGLHQALVLVFIIIINIALGFFQEFKAERALSELKRSFYAGSRVLRNGKIRNIPNVELVPGDVVILEAGDKVPADLRIIEEEGLRADESALTGESVPRSKSVETIRKNTALADRKNMLYAGTLIVAGRGRGIVAAIGSRTEFGQIANLVTGPESKTPLESQIEYLGKRITLISAVVAVLVFAGGYLRGLDVWPLLTFVIALLVAAVPESLPTAITLSLAIGVARMAKQKAIVRRMAAVETLGTVNIIATDKTGTLTNNHLVIDTVSLCRDGSWQRFQSADSALEDIFVHGLVCSNINMADGEYFGDPVEVAIAEKAREIAKPALHRAAGGQRLMEVPFDSDKKYMVVLVRWQGASEVIVKGAPEQLIAVSDLSKEDKETAYAEARDLGARGFKVIAVAEKHRTDNFRLLKDLHLLGFFAMVDEPAAGVAESVKKAMLAGIRPIMITGDHPETARFVAEKIGFDVQDGEIISQEELVAMTDTELKKSLSKAKVFARVTPADKIKIVGLLQKIGYTVAMTGDGVNDAPAIKEADVGIAMGIKGTEVAKSSADIVLADDRYRTIISAVEYGRTIYDNIKNVIVHLLSGNLNEILLVGLAFLFGLPSPLTTMQILWVNMVTDSFPALALSFEKPSRHVLREKPRPAAEASLKDPIKYAAYLSIASFSLCIFIYFYGLRISAEKAQTLAFTFFVLSELALCFSLRSKKRIWQSPKSFFDNKPLIYALIFSLFAQGIIFIGPLREIFNLTILSSNEIIVLVMAVLTAFTAAELIRWWHDKSLSVIPASACPVSEGIGEPVFDSEG